MYAADEVCNYYKERAVPLKDLTLNKSTITKDLID